MLAAILGGVVAIVLGIAGNLLTPYVRDFLHLPPEKEAPPSPTPPDTSHEPEDIEAVRARNREQLKTLVWQTYLYGSSFYFIYMAIYLPLRFAALTNGQLDLSGSRLGIDRLLAQENFTTFAALVAVVLFAPLWLLAQKIAQGAAAIWRRFYYLGPIRFGAFVTLSVALLSLILAGHVIYALYPGKSYTEAVLFPFILFFIIAAIATSRK